jgi:hypothetical protein
MAAMLIGYARCNWTGSPGRCLAPGQSPTSSPRARFVSIWAGRCTTPRIRLAGCSSSARDGC